MKRLIDLLEPKDLFTLFFILFVIAVIKAAMIIS